MSWIKKSKEEEFATIKFKNLRKSLHIAPQVGMSNFKRDIARKALAPGKRRSKSGKTYYETRKNRSDSVGKKI